MGAAHKQEQMDLVFQALKQMPFFHSFPDEFLKELASTCELAQYRIGEEILTQGQLNHHLFFLITGRVSVAVDSGVVAELMTIGDVLGEMSVITKKPCTATIVADSEVIAMKLPVNLLEEHSSAQSDRFKYLLYRVYASVLTKKLDETNQKAKHLETVSLNLEKAQKELKEVNSSLEVKVQERTKDLKTKSEALQASHQKLESQNLELVSSHKKLEELYTTKNTTFSKLEDLYKNHLGKLKNDLTELQPHVKEEAQSLVAAASKKLTDTMALLKPISELYSTEQSMKSKKVLLVESNKKQQTLAKLALGGTGVNLKIVSSIDELVPGVDDTHDIIFLDADSYGKTADFRARHPNADFVLMTSDQIKNYFPLLQSSPTLPNIVSRAEGDRGFTIKNIVTTVTKLTSKDFFGLDKYLSWGADVKSVPVVASDKRAEYIQNMEEYFSTLGIRSSSRGRASLVSEELLMNAIYDAPVDANGKSLFNHKTRQEVIYLKPNQQSKFRYATDGTLMAVSVEDPFGSLSGKVILNYLESCYGNAAGSMNSQKGGAGRGLHQIVENSDLVVFNIHPGVKTEVIALFYLEKSDAQDKTPSFHLFIA